MKKIFAYISLLLAGTIFSLSAVDYVQFTQPKTGTNLVNLILMELSGKSPYASEPHYNKQAFPYRIYSRVIKDPRLFIYSLHRYPWKVSEASEHLATAKEQQKYLQLHAPYFPTTESFLRERNHIVFYNLRDPRDQVVSYHNHFKKFGHPNPSWQNLSDEEQIMAMIKGVNWHSGIRFEFLSYFGWASSDICCCLDFAKLMGSHGGAATDEDALGELRKIAAALELDVSDETLMEIYGRSFGNSWTFHRGIVGRWKEIFTEEHKRAFKEEMGDILIDLGFEQDNNW